MDQSSTGTRTFPLFAILLRLDYMKLQDILVIMQNRMLSLNEARKAAVISGNLEQVMLIDADINTTENSIQQLKTAISTS